MKGKFTIYTCVIAILAIACQNSKDSNQSAKTIGNLKISKEEPQAGDDLNIRYKPEDPNFLDDEFSAFYYIIVDDNIYAKDLDMDDAEEAKKGKVTIPDSATAMAFNFKNDEDYDTNNNQGYIFVLYNNDNAIIPGGLASKAGYHRQMDARIGIEDSPTDSIVKWMKSDIEQHPDIEKEWEGPYAEILLKNNRAEGEAYINDRLEAYTDKDDLSKEDYNAIISFYQHLKDETKKDSVIEVAAQDYPKGEIAQSAFSTKFKKADSREEKAKVFEQYQDSIGADGQFKDIMLNQLIQLAQRDDDIDKVESYAAKLSDKSQKAFTYNNIALHKLETDDQLDDAVAMAKNAVETFSPENLDKPDILPQSQFETAVKRNAAQLRDTYAQALFEKGESTQALDEQKHAVGDGDNPELNAHYIHYLVENEDFEEAEEKAGDFIAAGHSNADLKSYFKEAYTANHNTDEGYDNKLASFEEKAYEKTKQEIQSDMIDKEVPDLHLTDPDGKAVELADLKGKTVVLDFWATWCGPCIQSFPGMEKAMQHFKNNDDVEFYYVNTFQREDEDERHEKVANFIDDNDYPFDILYDENADNDFKTASNFGITGIPTKIIIGPDGKWNFTKVGYGGNNDKLLDEIKIMVELAQS